MFVVVDTTTSDLSHHDSQSLTSLVTIPDDAVVMQQDLRLCDQPGTDLGRRSSPNHQNRNYQVQFAERDESNYFVDVGRTLYQ